MAYVAKDKCGDEYMYAYIPKRLEFEWYDTDYFIELPKGTIKKLVGFDMSWSDDPIELK